MTPIQCEHCGDDSGGKRYCDRRCKELAYKVRRGEREPWLLNLKEARAATADEHENFLRAHRDNMAAALRIAELRAEVLELEAAAAHRIDKCRENASLLAQIEKMRGALLWAKDSISPMQGQTIRKINDALASTPKPDS